MTPKQSRGAPRVIDSDAPVPPALDLSRRQSEHRAATGRLLARLKALERSQDTQTPRAYARRYVREQESLILGLLNAGVGTEEILADLALTFPSIPTADFRHALAQLRDRHRKHLAAHVENSFTSIPFTSFCRAGHRALTERPKRTDPIIGRSMWVPASRRSQRGESPAQLGWPQGAGASTIARRLRLARNKKQERKDGEA